MIAMSTRTKRLFDVVGAIGGLIVFAPPMAAIAAAILVLDGRPIVFRQTRVGRGRRPFTILKFRTMRNGMVTAVGRVLRSTGLDELPQLVNVLGGELSAVGPRPLTEADVQRLGWTTAACDFRWSVPPGLTGLVRSSGRDPPATRCVWIAAISRARTSGSTPASLPRSFVINVLGKRRVRLILRS